MLNDNDKEILVNIGGTIIFGIVFFLVGLLFGGIAYFTIILIKFCISGNGDTPIWVLWLCTSIASSGFLGYFYTQLVDLNY